MFDVVIIERGPIWEWQVRDREGAILLRGWEHTRRAARYKGDRALFLLLAAGTTTDPKRRRDVGN
jgi:hypothetical protein